MKILGIIILASLAQLLSGCVPSGDLTQSDANSSNLELTVAPAFLEMKRDSESRLVISGGTPPYQITTSDSSMGSTFIEAKASIASVFTKPAFTGNFTVIVTDSSGERKLINVEVKDGFKIYPSSRQVYPGRKVQITPLEGDLSSYNFTLIQGDSFGSIDTDGVLSINHDAPDNQLIVVEVENSNSGEKEKSFIYIREQLDSENLTLSVGYLHTCLAKTNSNQSSSYLQCWGNKSYGGLGTPGGLVSSESATEVTNSKIITSLATQYPKQVELSNGVGCATFFAGFYNQAEAPTKNARYVKCWGSANGSPDTNTGLLPNTMGANLQAYSFEADNNSPLYIKKLVRGLDFHCALLSSNVEASFNGSGDHDGEVRCWGIASHKNNEDVRTNYNGGRARLGHNSPVHTHLNEIAGNAENFGALKYNLDGDDKEILKFPLYAHTVISSFDATAPAFHNLTSENKYTTYTTPGNFTKIKAKDVASGAYHTCTIRADAPHEDNITCWGSNSSGQVTGSPYNQQYGGSIFSPLNRITPDNTTFDPTTNGVTPLKMFAGNTHTCVIGEIANGNPQLYCWGANHYRQSLPTSSSTSFSHSYTLPESGTKRPVRFYNAEGVEEFPISGVAGGRHTCVIVNTDPLATKGRVVCFGGNSYGQRGIGTFGGTSTSLVNGEYVDLGNLSLNNGSTKPYEAVKLTSAYDSICALLEKSTGDDAHSVKCWGRNNINQLGFGDTLNRAKASDADGFTIGDGQVIDITSSYSGGFCALKISGVMKCWGHSGQGKLGQENFLVGHDNPENPFHKVKNNDLQTFGKEIKSLTSAPHKNCALFKSGETHCWGYNYRNPLGLNPIYYNNNNRSVGDDFGEIDGVKTFAGGLSSPFKDIQLSNNNGCAIDSNDRVRCWGSRYSGINANSNNSDYITSAENAVPIVAFSNNKVLQISTGNDHVCAIFENSLGAKEVQCWGYNYHGQLGQTTNTRFVGRYPDQRHNENPTPFIDHIQSPVQLNLGAGDDILQVSSGTYHSCVLVEKAGTKEENYVKCWGWADRIGVSPDPWSNNGIPGARRYQGTNFVTPKLNFHGDNPIQVAASRNHTCVLFDTEQIKCWGANNSYGVLGWNAPPEYRKVVAPKGIGYVELGPGRRATRIFTSANSWHTCAILDKDENNDQKYDVKCWGRNTFGQLGVGSTQDSNSDNRYDILKSEQSLLKYK